MSFRLNPYRRVFLCLARNQKTDFVLASDISSFCFLFFSFLFRLLWLFPFYGYYTVQFRAINVCRNVLFLSDVIMLIYGVGRSLNGFLRRVDWFSPKINEWEVVLDFLLLLRRCVVWSCCSLQHDERNIIKIQKMPRWRLFLLAFSCVFRLGSVQTQIDVTWHVFISQHFSPLSLLSL